MQAVEEKSVNQIKEAVIKVIVFFDMFDYPLTFFEVWKYCGVKCLMSEVLEVLNKIEFEPHPNPRQFGGQAPPAYRTGRLETRGGGNDKGFQPETLLSYDLTGGQTHEPTPPLPLAKGGSKIETKNGFYFLSGRSGIVNTRLERYNITDRKMKRALRIIKIFKIVPWIKMIAVGNIIGANNAKEESDIDLFIITENKRIFITRFFCVTIIKFLGMRPAKDRMKDKICLSFFVGENAMGMERLMMRASDSLGGELYKPHPNPLPAYRTGRLETRGGENNEGPHPDPLEGEIPQALFIKGSNYQDIYFIYWLASLIPVFDRDKTYRKFIAANSWIYESLPNWQVHLRTYWRDAGRGLSFFYRDIIDLFIGGLERNFKKFEMKKLPADITEMMNKDSRVVVTDEILKFHVNDRREKYRAKYSEKMINFLNKNYR